MRTIKTCSKHVPFYNAFIVHLRDRLSEPATFIRHETVDSVLRAPCDGAFRVVFLSEVVALHKRLGAMDEQCAATDPQSFEILRFVSFQGF